MSSGSESDEEYVPGEPENLSEEGSADEETDLQFEKELENKTKKRTAVLQSKGRKKQKVLKNVKEIVSEEKTEVSEDKVDPEEVKKKEDDLWAKFLEGTDTKPKEKNTCNSTNSLVKTDNVNAAKPLTNNVKQNNDSEKAREKRIFEFAGETIVVENDVIKERTKSCESPASVSKPVAPLSKARGSGGLSSVLGQINKKNTLSTLEKSKLDWNTYKKVEGIEEEIESHNKGKDGYLDRQDFLERADHRQYEIERNLRMSRRSNR